MGVCPASVLDNSCVTAPRSGSRRVNVLPPPTWLCTTMSPPCSRRILRLTARPRPVPRDPLRADERPEDLRQLLRRDAGAVVRHLDPHPFAVRLAQRRHRHLRARPPPPPRPGRCRRCSAAPGERPPGRPGISARPRPAAVVSSTPSSLARGADQLHHVADHGVEVGLLQGRLAVLGVAEHVHDQVVDLALVLLDDRPALLQQPRRPCPPCPS